MSKDTLFQAKHSHCLSSSSYLGAGSLYVFSSTIIQMVSRGFTPREFTSRSPFAIKFPNPSDTMSACAPLFSLQGFQGFQGFKALNLNHFWTNFEPTLNQLEPTLNLNLSRLSRLQGFELEPSFAGHISSYRCARNFDIVKLKFFYLSFDNISHTF